MAHVGRSRAGFRYSGFPALSCPLLVPEEGGPPNNEVSHLERTVCLQRLYYRKGSGRRRQEYLKTHFSEEREKSDLKGS